MGLSLITARHDSILRKKKVGIISTEGVIDHGGLTVVFSSTTENEGEEGWMLDSGGCVADASQGTEMIKEFIGVRTVSEFMPHQVYPINIVETINSTITM